MIDQEYLRDKHGTLEKIFKDPYDAKKVKWIAWIGMPMLVLEVLSIVGDIATHEHPFEEFMSDGGRTYFRIGILAFGLWAVVVLYRTRKSRQKYGYSYMVLDTELSKYGKTAELRSSINSELASLKTMFMDGCVVTENWMISYAHLGYPAKVIPLNRIRYIGKFSAPSLVLFDEKIDELTVVEGRDEKALEGVASYLQTKLPKIEFYGYYLLDYNAKAAKFNIEDAKKDGQLWKQQIEMQD
jgi:hypothetical protein